MQDVKKRQHAGKNHSYRNTVKFLIIFAAHFTVSPMSKADDLFQFHAFNMQYLYGTTHELGKRERHVITLQYANGWKYGDTFAFMDISEMDTIYAEIHPRFSLSKITGQKFSYGILKDISIATTFEFPEAPNRQLYGVGLDWDIPGFRFFKTNFYKRFDPSLTGSSEQVTVIWNYPFTIGKQPFLLDGFLDIATKEGDRVSNQHIQASLLWQPFHDIKNIWVGTEYILWHNKFGLRGVDESVAQFQLRINF